MKRKKSENFAEQSVESVLLTSDANALLRALDNTGVCVFTYYPQQKKIYVPEKARERYGCSAIYVNMPQSFADDYVHPNDYLAFSEMYYKIDAGMPTASSEFHSKDFEFCNRVTLTTIKNDENNRPLEAIGVIEDASEFFKSDLLVKEIQAKLDAGIASSDDEMQEIMNLIASAIGTQYYAIYHIWMESEQYVCFEEKLPGILSDIGVKGDFTTAWFSYINEYVEEEDREAMRAFADLGTLGARLKDTNVVMYEYRRKGVGWTRGQFVVAKRDNNGNVTNVLYTVSDINKEMERKQEQKNALFEAQHDPLTGVYNRKGFDDIIHEQHEGSGKIGFALLDVDEFKSINDTYGHDIGDRILKQVAGSLSETFRNKDDIFRFGGDEFCILLRDCGEEIWEALCRKLEFIHATLHQSFPEMVPITLSVGLCFSEYGFSDELPILADEALYETKRNGRAGCTLVQNDHKVIKRWRDDNVSVHAEKALERSSTGVFRIELDEDPNVAPRMICNEIAKSVLGVADNVTPEDCFAHWAKGIEPSYRDAVYQTKQEMMKQQQAECTYLWNHPTWGMIFVRSGGFGERVNGKEVLYGYHHALKDTNIVERRDDNKKILDALNDMFFASYYIDLQDNTFMTVKSVSYAREIIGTKYKNKDGFNSFINSLVKPEYQDKLREFCDMSTLKDRLKNEAHIDCEYESRVEQGWCRASFVPVDYDRDGNLWHVMFVISGVDKNLATEIEESIHYKKSLEALFDNVPGGVVMYEWDGKSLKVLHISDYYLQHYGSALIANDGGPDYVRVHPDDVEGYQAAIMNALTHTHHLEYVFRVWHRKWEKYVWTKITAVSETLDDGTELVYAMYTNIDEQVEAEQQLIKSAASMTEALATSGQLSYEYDPEEATATSFTEENFLGLPKRIENFPEALREWDVIHPQDIEIFMEATHRIADNHEQAVCEVRAKKDGKYNWYSCTFHKYEDPYKEHAVAIVTVIDISLRKKMAGDFENRFHTLLTNNEKAVSIGRFNLTADTFKAVRAEDKMVSFMDETKPFSQLLKESAVLIPEEEERKEFLEVFNLPNLRRCAEEGIRHISVSHFFRAEGEHTELMESTADIVRNPITGDFVGICCTKSVRESKLSAWLLKKTLQQDYPMSAIVYTETDEYYLFDAKEGAYKECNYHFWDSLGKALEPICSDYTAEALMAQLPKERILEVLSRDEEFAYAFDSVLHGRPGRLEIKFSNLSKERHLILASLRDITDRVLLDKLRHDSGHDLLTGLYNRRKAFEESRKLLNEHPDDHFVVAHIDMKHFHLFNTFFGDEAGDRLLCDVSDMFRRMDPDYDYWVYGRIEADVFFAMFPYKKEILDKYINTVFAQLETYRADFTIEPVLGLYFVTDKEMPVEAMFTRATMASKMVGINRDEPVAVYDASMEEKMARDQQIVQEMHDAIEQEQFEVYLQPKYSLQTNRPIGAEALARWIHPTHGMVSPGQFIPVFERNGFIATLDRYMWEHVCMLLSKWREEGKPMIPISVNVSRISAFSPHTIPFLKHLLEKYELDPKYLELELTETAYIDDPEEMKSQMNRLRDLGFRILMDDFGSGYSSLNSLREMPVDCLKLDMKFLSEAPSDLRGSLVLTSIVRMSKMLDLYVIAEGVETEEQADFLRSIGCECVQGFLFARPMPIAEYEALLAQHESLKFEKNKDAIALIGKMLADTSTETYALGQVIPVPMALMEHTAGRTIFSRVNTFFFKEFGLGEGEQFSEKRVREHLSAEDLQRARDAIATCVETEELVEFEVSWFDSEDENRRYLCRVDYEGKVENTSALVVVLVNMSAYV